MKVLVACEYSGIVRDAFSRKGHDAWSCDLLPTESELTMKEGKHIQDDAIKVAYSYHWDLMIAHPPCTYLSYAGNRYFNEDVWGEKAKERKRLGEDALKFFRKLLKAEHIHKRCIENPAGEPMVHWKNFQIIQPWYFGEKHKKRTLLWLVNLPKLNAPLEIALNPEKYEPKPLGYNNKTGKAYYFNEMVKGSGEKRRKNRSKFWPGIAKAMADQWG